MSLKEKLMEDLKIAMKEKDQLKKSVITMVRASIKQYEVDHRVELDDDSVLEIMSKQVKQKKDAIEEFAKGGREDLVNEAKAEIEVLLTYLPKQLTEDEISEIVVQVLNETGASTAKDMGKVMAALMPKVKGRADGKLVNQVVKKHLQ
ncbi:GatB/YqeY domain-containing protein [Geosporobacter ferrireducens]|uniref:Aspartyl-tRNA amidotransferase n=1 Tax=Geosporobacter ferrireducens TaxID=1424294 RepID=A0A1D8GCA0_9FIRM|nr:GatB/YqeY domain-containing protein [Geosporobacter ferrireducens]AOT68526.1 aspartyl-tRNA amidotransferase [Geosporobacter ferrireducens]MTI53991.1 GatB/YqeY domain-containing protein [Geosporobacter ferrireducens]